MKSVSRLMPGLMSGLLVVGCAVASAPALASPTNPYAPRTRAEVRADLVDWLNAGFDPVDWVNYPENAQRAGAIVAQRRAARAATGTQAPTQP